MLGKAFIGSGGSADRVLALVLASGRGRALQGLTASQTPAAVPFGGHNRIVDFVLSNCVNSEIRRIALLTQYRSQSLIRHVHRGWGFLHRELGEYVEIWPAQQQDGERWYRGTVDAVYQNLDLVEATGAHHVLVLAGDQIYSLDYSTLLETHAALSADVTVACGHATGREQTAMVASDGRLTRIEFSPPAAACEAPPRLAPMGAYLFDADFLATCVREAQRDSATADFARDLVPALADRCRAVACVHDTADRPGYWRVLDTLDRYWRAHMELLQSPHATIFCNPDWPVFTRHEPLPAARVLEDAFLASSLVSPGAVVAGQVTHSVVSARSRVGAGAIVKDSVLLPGAAVGEGCSLERVVVDAGYEVPANSQLGPGSFAPDGARYFTSPGGIVFASAAAAATPPATDVRRIA
jgi:glucose-1-phosphate adenylyltransferase